MQAESSSGDELSIQESRDKIRINPMGETLVRHSLGWLSVRESSDILDRNLRRTADLINSFKQVAVDQTSEQRRKFNCMRWLMKCW